MNAPPDLATMRAAEARIRPHVLRTPILRNPNADLLLKAENLQFTGAFKLRGAFNALLSLADAQRARGVIAHSSGNHAQAVAYAASRLGIAATVVMPTDAPAVKRAATEHWGATMVFTGAGFVERAHVAAKLASERGLTPIDPYDDPAIVAGAASVGIEIAEDAPALRHVYVQASGGGLCAGVASALAALRPGVEIVAVEPQLCGHVALSLSAGAPVTITPEQSGRTIADGMRANRLGDVPWRAIGRHVHRSVAVSEDEIFDAMAWLLREWRIVAEPAGATAVAAALADPNRRGPSLAIVSGGNVDASLLAHLLDRDESLGDSQTPSDPMQRASA